jgi:hypothetical protein
LRFRADGGHMQLDSACRETMRRRLRKPGCAFRRESRGSR